MLKSMKLRWKIPLALIGISVIPLLITTLIFSQLIEGAFDRNLEARFQQVSNFASRTATLSQKEVLNYVRLMSRNNDVVNAIYYASLTGEAEQLEEVLRDSQEIFHFDLIEVRDTNGELLLREVPGKAKIPQTTGKEHPIIQASLAGEPMSGVEPYDGELSIVAAAPMRLQGEVIGHLVGVNFLDEKFATQVKSLSGAEVAFFDRGGIVAASREGMAGVPLEPILQGEKDEMVLAGRPHTVSVKNLGGPERGFLVALDRSEVLAARQNVRTVLGGVIAAAVVLAVLIGLAISRGIVRPLAEVVGNLKEIAEGEADLTRDLPVRSGDEVGELAASFNNFVAKLREMVSRTRAVSADLNQATDQVRTSAREVNDGAKQQSESLEESHRAIQSIEESVSGIAESTGSLVDSAEESSSATLELGATIEEIASQMEKLFGIVDEVSSSINEMSVSSQQVAENVEVLSSSTEVTASSITELDASIKEIEENAERTNTLSEQAAQDAEVGKKAVDANIEGITALRESVDRATGAIEELGDQSSAIGKILTVIDDVADQTSLLALNAAIIAAQAGEHGKGFAVVADEIRELAERTAVSTREIASIIGNLQSGTKDAVAAMQAGSQRVHEEVNRSQEAGVALEKIRNSTLTASEQVRGIVRATQEQSRGSRQITNSINQVASMLGQIAAAIKQQTEGTRQLAQAAESMKEVASQVKLSTGEQTKGSKQINSSMEHIRNMIERIDAATREQTQRNRQVLEAVASIRRVAEATASRTAGLDEVVEILSRQTTTLEEEVGAFKA